MSYYIKEGQRSAFTKIKFKENECKIPILNCNVKKNEKIVKKIKKKNIDLVVLSNKIKEHTEFIKILNNYDITIFDGKWLMQYLIEDIIEYLEKIGKLSFTDEITILANDLTNEVKKNINKFANKYKKIRIISNHLEKFKRLEEELYDQVGISIIATNNKRKALAKSSLIVNFDFVEESINQYNINENATIINISEKLKINKKRFSGVIITDYEVEIGDVAETEKDLDLEDIFEKEKDFYLKETLEQKIYSATCKQPDFSKFEIIEEIIKKYKIKIKEVYGISGKIG